MCRAFAILPKMTWVGWVRGAKGCGGKGTERGARAKHAGVRVNSHAGAYAWMCVCMRVGNTPTRTWTCALGHALIAETRPGM
jgi:hypothetical protein